MTKVGDATPLKSPVRTNFNITPCRDDIIDYNVKIYEQISSIAGKTWPLSHTYLKNSPAVKPAFKLCLNYAQKIILTWDWLSVMNDWECTIRSDSAIFGYALRDASGKLWSWPDNAEKSRLWGALEPGVYSGEVGCWSGPVPWNGIWILIKQVSSVCLNMLKGIFRWLEKTREWTYLVVNCFQLPQQ